MKIFDGHTHITVGKCDYLALFNYDILSLITDMKINNVEKSIVSANPFVKSVFCPNDCRVTCVYASESDYKLCSQDCRYKNKHRTKIRIVKIDTEELYCSCCGYVIYSDNDPYRYLNDELINETSNYEKIIPLCSLPLLKKNQQNEIERCETIYKDRFAGYKIHINVTGRRFTNYEIPTKKTLLLHTNGDEDGVHNYIELASRQQGNIVLAHGFLFGSDNLKKLSKCENIYIDISAMSASKSANGYHNLKARTYENAIKKILDKFDYTRIIFGSDARFSPMERELEDFLNTELTLNIKKTILYDNVVNAYKL